MSSVDKKRWQLIAALAVAAILSGVGTQTQNTIIGWLGAVAFAASVLLYFRWRRAAVAERRGRVFAREAKTDETRTGPDK
jgi:hypothetical protein